MGWDDNGAIRMDQSHIVVANQSYAALNALFQLPISEKKANPVAAEIYMDSLLAEDVNDTDEETQRTKE